MKVRVSPAQGKMFQAMVGPHCVFIQRDGNYDGDDYLDHWTHASGPNRTWRFTGGPYAVETDLLPSLVRALLEP